jgi:predicted enzyme related to lactoylglutathione lyase
MIVPPGSIADGQIGIHYAVRDVRRAGDFFAGALGLPVEGTTVLIGNSRLMLDEDPMAAIDPPVEAPGWRYMTLQVFDAAGLYHDVVARGGREGRPPRTLGDIAHYALVRDMEGNWIELSQRASLTGPIPPEGDA